MVDEMTMTTHSPQETERLGEALGALLQPGDVILLSGDLGAGKTTFAKGVGRGLGVTAAMTSPTFTLVNEYEGRIPLAHMDLYRLYEGGEDVLAAGIGWEDYLERDAAVLIEWPEGVADEVEDALCIHISRAPLPRVDERTLRCKATGPRSWTLLDEWVKRWLF